jgi:hypothetical protein
MADRSDTFDRADSAVSINSPSDGGANWVADAGTWGISSNRAYNPSAANPGVCRLSDGGTVGSVQVNFPVAPADRQGIFLRATDGTNYMVMWARPGVSQVLLRKYVAGTPTTVVSVTSTGWVANDVMKLEVTSGNVFRMYKNGAQIGTDYTEAFNTSSTGVGLWSQSDSTGRFDSFVHDDTAAAVAASFVAFRRPTRFFTRRF